jgi:hypothetical protein
MPPMQTDLVSCSTGLLENLAAGDGKVNGSSSAAFQKKRTCC